MKSLEWLISCMITELSDHAQLIVAEEVRSNPDHFRRIVDEAYLGETPISLARYEQLQSWLKEILS